MKQNRKRTRILIGAAVGVFALAALLPQGASADPIAEFSAKERQLTKKAGEVQTLEDELDLLEETADVKLVALAEIRGRVKEIRGELAEVTARLDELVSDRYSAKGSLQKVIRIDYVEGEPNVWEVVSGPGGLSETLSEVHANGALGDYANGLAKNISESSKSIDQDRQRLVSRKRNLDLLLAEAERQVRELEAVRGVKENLLKTSQGEEDRFRAQFEEARKQLEKLGLFGASGCSRVGQRVWDGRGGYFNQCDSRWDGAHLGFSSSSTIGDFGCGLTSAAITFRRYGISTDPLRLNDELKRVRAFVGDLMDWRNVYHASRGKLRPANDPYPVGRANVDWGHIDRQLRSGNPVIVYVDRPGQYSHYVTLIRKASGGYVMHDPIEGPFLRFEDYYSRGAVFQYITFRRA